MNGLAALQSALAEPYEPPTGFWVTPFQRQQAFIEDQARRKGMVDAFLLPYDLKAYDIASRDQALDEAKFEMDRMFEPRRVSAYEMSARASLLGAQAQVQQIGLAEKELQASIDQKESMLDAIRQRKRDQVAAAIPLRSQLDESLTPKLFAMAGQMFKDTGVPALQNEGFLSALKDQTLDKMLDAIASGRDPDEVESVALNGLSQWLGRKTGWLALQQQRAEQGTWDAARTIPLQSQPPANGEAGAPLRSLMSPMLGGPRGLSLWEELQREVGLAKRITSEAGKRFKEAWVW